MPKYIVIENDQPVFWCISSNCVIRWFNRHPNGTLYRVVNKETNVQIEWRTKGLLNLELRTIEQVKNSRQSAVDSVNAFMESLK